MKLILPFSVTLPRKKKADKVWILNQNNYRNTHFQILNQAKIAWKSIVYDAYCNGQILPPWPWRFTYTVYPATRRSFDLANVCSIVQKFTDDALIDILAIPDDSYRQIPEVDYRFGGQDKENPRIELEIEPVSDADRAFDAVIKEWVCEPTGRPRLHDYDAIMPDVKSGMKNSEVARKHNISKSQVSRLRKIAGMYETGDNRLIEPPLIPPGRRLEMLLRRKAIALGVSVEYVRQVWINGAAGRQAMREML